MGVGLFEKSDREDSKAAWVLLLLRNWLHPRLWNLSQLEGYALRVRSKHGNPTAVSETLFAGSILKTKYGPVSSFPTL